MKPNIGNIDRYARLGLGILAILSAFYFKNIILGLIGLFSIYEALSSWCIIYQILGRNTCPIKKNKNI